MPPRLRASPWRRRFSSKGPSENGFKQPQTEGRVLRPRPCNPFPLTFTAELQGQALCLCLCHAHCVSPLQDPQPLSGAPSSRGVGALGGGVLHGLPGNCCYPGLHFLQEQPQPLHLEITVTRGPHVGVI